MIIGANESTSLYLLKHIEQYRRLYPKVKVQVRRSLSSKIPAQLIDGDLELGVISYDPEDERLISKVIYTDHLAFVVSPAAPLREAQDRVDHGTGHGDIHRAQRVIALPRGGAAGVSAAQGAAEHGRGDADSRDHPEDGAANEGVAFLPKMCVEQELEQKTLREVQVDEINVDREIRLVYPAKRALSHAAKAFLEVVKS